MLGLSRGWHNRDGGAEELVEGNHLFVVSYKKIANQYCVTIGVDNIM